jgi:hypothetical protein
MRLVCFLVFWLLTPIASAQRAPLPPIAGRFVTHLSISDFPQVWGKNARTWGVEGVRSLLDSVADTGVRAVNWRITCSGSLNYPTRVEGADAYRSPTLGADSGAR